ncbi:hypothetical protein MMC08_007092 [Hypocenomyce scalaris]|nr:hypothetical protein [Hypocenomyce scalaris]
MNFLAFTAGLLVTLAFASPQPLMPLPTGESLQVTLGFVGRVNIAVITVQDETSDARLYEVQATAPGGTGVTNPAALTQLQVVFSLKNNRCAIINSTAGGAFNPVQYSDKPWLQDLVVAWPIEMDAVEADALLKKAGYNSQYDEMTLRWPLYPGINQPYYIFTMVVGLFVFVGVNDKNVTLDPFSLGPGPSISQFLQATTTQAATA